MTKQIIGIIALLSVLSGCATVGESTLLGAGMMGALGTGVGAAAGNTQGAMIGLGVGAIIGAGMGYLTHKDNEEKARLANMGKPKKVEPTAPSLTSPEVRRVWVPEKIDGSKYIEGHYMYVIERNSVWSN